MIIIRTITFHARFSELWLILYVPAVAGEDVRPSFPSAPNLNRSEISKLWAVQLSQQVLGSAVLLSLLWKQHLVQQAYTWQCFGGSGIHLQVRTQFGSKSIEINTSGPKLSRQWSKCTHFISCWSTEIIILKLLKPLQDVWGCHLALTIVLDPMKQTPVMMQLSFPRLVHIFQSPALWKIKSDCRLRPSILCACLWWHHSPWAVHSHGWRSLQGSVEGR